MEMGPLPPRPSKPPKPSPATNSWVRSHPFDCAAPVPPGQSFYERCYNRAVPIYEYICDDCGTQYEKIVLSKTQEIACPKCASKKNKLQLSVFATSNGNGTSAKPAPKPGQGFSGGGSCCGGGGCGCH